MSVRSPFELFSRLPALSTILETPETKPKQFVIHGLLGAARSLAAGTMLMKLLAALMFFIMMQKFDVSGPKDPSRKECPKQRPLIGGCN